MVSGNEVNFAATRRKVLAAMGGATAVSVAGCVGEEEREDNEFVASVGGNPDTQDPTIIDDAPSNSTVGTMAYESLVELTFDLSEFRPELATDWEEVDETTWRFELREGVEFHNGDEFTAEDVAFSIERTRGTINGADVAWIEDVEILGDYEVEISGAVPHAPALNDLSAVPILPHDVDDVSEDPAADDFAFDEASIGTGAFELDEYAAEDRLVLTAFENYWYDGDDHPGTSPWETVTFRVITEQVSQEEAMRAGEVDMIDNPAPFDLDQWDDIDPEVVIDDAVGFDFITLPVNESPYDNPDFRRGMVRLIPSSDVIEQVFGGNATELAGPISPGLGAFWDEEHEQELLDEYIGENREEAEALLESAFEEEDIEMPFELELITNVNRTRERWMEVVQQTFDDTEFFDASLDVREFDDLVGFITDPEGAAESTDIVGIGWTGGSDPDGHINTLVHSDHHVPDGFNWNLYSNDEVDELIEDGQTTVDEDERRDVYHELQEVLAEDVPAAYMWTGDQIDIVSPDAFEDHTAWQPHPNSSFRYKTLYAPHLEQIAMPPQ